MPLQRAPGDTAPTIVPSAKRKRSRQYHNGDAGVTSEDEGTVDFAAELSEGLNGIYNDEDIEGVDNEGQTFERSKQRPKNLQASIPSPISSIEALPSTQRLSRQQPLALISPNVRSRNQRSRRNKPKIQDISTEFHKDGAQFVPSPLPDVPNLDDIVEVQKQLGEIKVKAFRKIEPPPLPIASLPTAPVFQERRCHSTPAVYTTAAYNEQTNSWVVKIHCSASEAASLKRSGKDKWRKSGINFHFDANSYDKGLVDAAAPYLRSLIDRWPFAIKFNGSADKTWRRILINIAIHQADPTASVLFPSVTWNRERYSIEVPYFNRETGEFEGHHELVNPKTLAERKIPLTPSYCNFEPQKKSGVSKKFPTPSDPSEQAQHQAAQDLCKYLSWRLYGLITTKNGIVTFALGLLQLHGINRTRQTTGFYGGKPFFALGPDRFAKKVYIYPSRRLQGDVAGQLPTILVKSLGRLRLAHVLQTMRSVWMQTGHPITAWEAGYLAAYRVNWQIEAHEATSSRCDCTATESSQNQHPCDQCLQPTLCADRVEDEEGNWLCESCNATQKQVMPSSLSIDECKGYKRLLDSFRSDARALGITGDARFSLLEETWRELCKHQTNFVFTDAYTGARRAMVALGRQTPFQVSWDANFPYTVHQRKVLVHGPDNVVPTALYLNLGKYVFIPAMLQIVVDYRAEQTRNTEAFIRKMDDIQMISIQAGYNRKSRVRAASGLSMSKLMKKMQLDREDWISAVPRRVSGAAKAILDDKAKRMSDWRLPNPEPKEIARISSLIAEMEAKFGGKIWRSSDGAPYPFHKSTIPEDWNWVACQNLFYSRLMRLWVRCNRKWQTIDTWETLLLECIWQALDPSYTEWLGLPMVPFICHPLRFVVAHLHHGQQMRTRWTKAHPETIDDRDDSLNNILFETCISNYMKADFPESDYDAILADFSTVKVPKQFYNPHVAPSNETIDEQDTMIFDEDQDDEDDLGGKRIDEDIEFLYGECGDVD